MISALVLVGALFCVQGASDAKRQDAKAQQLEGLAAAAGLIGLEFDEEELDQMLRDVRGRIRDYESLRASKLDNGVAPALSFHPAPIATGAPSRPGDPGAVFDNAARLDPDARRPARLEDMAFAGILDWAALIKNRQVSCVELCEMYLARLERLDKKLLCVIELTRDRALAQARALDAELDAGKWRGPLHGIPWGAKDLLAVRGTRTTWGAKPFEDQRIEVDATVVERLDAAGAVLIAKLTLGALAMGDVWFGGKTRNPWKPEQGSSGSSAGPAAATAGGCVVFTIGSETLGSIISPSARCGCSSLRPTFGRVSRYGAMALSWSMDKLGPLCRSAEDARLVLQVIAGPDGRDATVIARGGADAFWPDVEGWRIGVPVGALERSQGLAAVIGELEELGCVVEEVQLPEYPVNAMLVILMAEAATAFDELTRDGSDEQLVSQGRNSWPNSFRAARFIPAVEYLRAQRLRTLLMADFCTAIEGLDALVHPNYAAGLLGITNLTGHPTFIAPSGPSQGGTPPTISFTGQLYDEGRLLSLVQAWQAASDHHKQHPAEAGAGAEEDE